MSGHDSQEPGIVTVMVVHGVRGEVIAILSRMVADGMITGFRTLHFGKADTGEDRQVVVTVAGTHDQTRMRAIAIEVRQALKPVAGDLIVTVQREPGR